jgi:hypothetical protein
MKGAAPVAMPFELLGVVHLVRPAGRTAHTLEALRAGIADATVASLFMHVRQPLLRYAALGVAPADDFSHWVDGTVQDRETAERLSFAVQDHGADAEGLRVALLAVLGGLSGKTRRSGSVPEEGAFVFLEADSVTVRAGGTAGNCAELVEHLTRLGPSVLFYHLIEQPWLAPDRASLVEWVRACGDARLADWLAESGRSGRPLEELRVRLTRHWRRRGLAARVARAATAPEDVRRDHAQRAVTTLVRRIQRPENADDTDPGA